MIRLFETNKIRKQIELAGLWDFGVLAEDETIPKKYEYQMVVPGCWEMNPNFLTYRGRGAYRKYVTVDRTGALKLVFKGVSHTADVYFDGEHVKHHYNAFTPFSTVIPSVEAGQHEVVVIVDNSFSEVSSLHIPNDYYAYGGITRPVEMSYVSKTYIDRIQFTPFLEQGMWNAKIDVFVSNVSSMDTTVELKGTLCSQIFNFGEVCVEAGGSATISKAWAFPDTKAWSRKAPNLYLLNIQLFLKGQSQPCDDLIERVGFRTIQVQERKLLLNGEEVFMQGFNRHEDHPFGGCAIPFELMVKDMDMMEDMGINALRTSHYPNDERFLDLCDERGILVWEENHARGLSLERMQNPHFEIQCENCNREMVQNHYNHPCILIWGILNECASHTQEGSRMYQKQFAQIRSLDQSRLLTFACDKHFKDLSLEYVDIVSLNIYSGWYGDVDVTDYYLKELEWVESVVGKNKPIILSEFGGGAIYGYREPTRVKWTEERQCDILESTLSLYLNRNEIVGTFIWQYCDCRVTEEEWALQRPRTKNNKGIVDEYRRPKLAYYTVKKHYEGNKKVYK